MEEEKSLEAVQVEAKQEEKERRANTFREGYGIKKLRAARKRQRQAVKLAHRLRRERK